MYLITRAVKRYILLSPIEAIFQYIIYHLFLFVFVIGSSIAATHPPSDSFLSDFFLLRNFAKDVSARGMGDIFIIELEICANSI